MKNSTPLCISSIKAEWLSFFRAWQKALSVTFLSATSEPETVLKKLSISFCMDDLKRFMRNNTTVINGRLLVLLKSFDDLLWREIKSCEVTAMTHQNIFGSSIGTTQSNFCKNLVFEPNFL